MRRSWRLNERHYGALQGKSKEQTRLEFGDAQYMLWRRSYDVPPPPLDPDSEWATGADPATATWRPTSCPLRNASRTSWSACSRTGTTRSCRTCALTASYSSSAHGNSLRALVKHLDAIADDEIAELNLPTGVPLLYELDDRLAPLRAVDPAFGVSGRYLDADAARASIAGVRRPGLRRDRPADP